MTDYFDQDDATTPNEAVNRLTKDLIKGAAILSDAEARFLVDYYYICQEDRKRFKNQDRSLTKHGEPSMLVDYLGEQARVLENQVKRALNAYTLAHQMGAYMRSVVGIGPVISAGLLAHIDIAKAPTVGHIWTFAGLNPTSKWEKGEKRPHNTRLKTLCYHAGECFIKFSGRDDCYYGKIYIERKAYEVARNESGENKDLAASLLAKFTSDTESRKHLLNGVLPPAQIHARARRYAIKMFLSHMHSHWYNLHHGVDMPPSPYPIAILGHAHYIAPPPYVGPAAKKKAKPGPVKRLGVKKMPSQANPIRH